MKSLIDLFDGRSQLLVYHFMFAPDYTAGCAASSAIAGGVNGFVRTAGPGRISWYASTSSRAIRAGWKSRPLPSRSRSPADRPLLRRATRRPPAIWPALQVAGITGSGRLSAGILVRDVRGIS
jgi:hypothetical protein